MPGVCQCLYTINFGSALRSSASPASVTLVPLSVNSRSVVILRSCKIASSVTVVPQIPSVLDPQKLSRLSQVSCRHFLGLDPMVDVCVKAFEAVA